MLKVQFDQVQVLHLLRWFTHTKLTSTSIFCGRLALVALGWLWWRAWLPVTPLRFVWQAWNLGASAFTLRGNINFHFCVEGVALVARGWRGTWGHQPSLWVCVAGVALVALGWLWLRAWFPVTRLHFVCQAWNLGASTFTLRSNINSHFCLEGVALVALVWLSWRAFFPVTTSSRITLSLTPLLHISFPHIFHMQLFHIQVCPSFTRNIVTHTHTQLFHTHVML